MFSSVLADSESHNGVEHEYMGSDCNSMAGAAGPPRIPMSSCIPRGSNVSIKLLSFECLNSPESFTSYAPTTLDAWNDEDIRC